MRQAGISNRMGSMTHPSKFLFNVDFSEPVEPEVEPVSEPEIPTITVEEHSKLLEKARAQAFEEGRAKALTDMQTRQETLLTQEIVRLIDAVTEMIGTLDRIEADQEKDAVSLAFLVARRLCAHLIARQPLAETVALVSECLGPLRRAPHLVIRIAEKDVEALKAQVDPIIHEKGFEGRLVILGEPDLARGDCHIEWADGGIRRDRKALEAGIDASIRSYLRARSAVKKGHAPDASAKKDSDV